MSLLILHGTNRPENKSIAVARWIAEQADQEKIKSLFQPALTPELYSPTDFQVRADGRNPNTIDPGFVEKVASAKAFLFVIPEYNRSFPGAFKTLLDTAYAEYNQKPVGFAGVSNGPFGGVRAIESLLPVARAVGLLMMKSDLYFPNIDEKVQDGVFVPDEKDARRVFEFFEKLAELTNILSNRVR